MEDVIGGEDRNLASQYIIDLASEQVRSLFTAPEWEEIQAVAKPRSNPVVPDIDIQDLESLMSAGLRWVGSKDPTEAWLGTTMLGA